MPPSPLEERIGVLQRPKTLALRLTHTFVTHGTGGEKPLSPSAPAAGQDPCEGLRRSSILLPGHSHTLDLKPQGRGSERGSAWPPDLKQGEKKLPLTPQLKALLTEAKLKKRGGLKENADPSGDASPSSTLSSPATTMHPLKCGCWGCWRLMRCEDAGAKSGLRSLGCFSSRSSLRSLGCPACSPQAVKKLGCFSCGPVALRSLACLACNLSVKSASSSSSFCSSDPIVAYDPRVGSSPAPSCYGGDGEEEEEEGDEYTGHNVWPDELAKKISTTPPQPPPWVQPQSSPLILDCRNLVEFTKAQLQGAMRFGVADAPGRRRFQQGKLAVLDFLSSRGSCDGRDSSRQCLWSKEGSGCGGVLESPLPSPPKPPKAAPPMQNLHLVLDLVHRDEQGLGKRGSPIGSDALEVSDEVGSPLTPDLENAELSPILPFLYLGNERDAQNVEILLHLNVGHVLNVTTHLPLYHAESGRLRYKRLPATDNNRQDLRQYFEEAFEFIEEAHQSGKGVLVHCQAGVSRSATIVIAYLMKHTLMTMGDAYKYVKGRRPVISPNLNFMGQLLQFETDLNAGVTPRILTPKLAGVETEV